MKEFTARVSTAAFAAAAFPASSERPTWGKAVCELEGGKAKLDRGLSWSGGDRGWVLRGGVVLGGGNGDGGRRSRAQGGEWGLGLGWNGEGRGRNVYLSRRPGRAGPRWRREGEGAPASKRRRRRRRRTKTGRAGLARRPGGGVAAERGPGVEAAAVDDRAAAEDDRQRWQRQTIGHREGQRWKEQVRKKETWQELIYPKGLRYRLVSPTGA